MIPKKIHYCWFGRNPKPNIVKNCIKSWREKCPEYEIIEWNEDNFDVNCCDYVREAYEAKKWAFVSDYARFYVLNKFGGVYVDTDVELIKPIDQFLESKFAGFENSQLVNTGLIMGTTPDDELCKTMLARYEVDHFVKDGKLNLCTVCDRVTDILVDNGLELVDKTQQVMNYTIYNTRYFSPMDLDSGKITISPETVSIHRFAGTWTSKGARIRGKIYRMLTRMFGKDFADKVRKLTR